MNPTFLSSGDLIVDRRAHYAQMLAEAGDHAAAAEVMEQALADASHWAAGWMMLGGYRLDAGALGGAILAWRTAAGLDPSGALGAQMHLAAHGIGEVEPEKQAAYVEALFDQYAERFEDSLVGKLDYVVPGKLSALIAEAAEATGTQGFARGLDLGCGTGLMGERVRHWVSHLVGVDLSGAMVEAARGKGIYDAVEQGDLVTFLDAPGRVADLVVAADVFMYVPGLPPVFDAVRAALRPGGLFAFSVERHEGEDDQVLQPTLRYAHKEEAVREELLAAGFTVLRVTREAIRRDRGAPVEGLLVVARKPETRPATLPDAGEVRAPAVVH